MTGLLGYLAARGLRHLVNTRSSASHPVALRMSESRLRDLCPSLYFTGLSGFLRCTFWDGLYLRYYIRDMLVHGDSRTAVAMSVSPFLVACYCDDLDGVCVLRFRDAQAEEHGIRRGDRLLTGADSVCACSWQSRRACAGPRPGIRRTRCRISGRSSPSYSPMTSRKSPGASPDYGREYTRCVSLANEHLNASVAPRDGRPDLSVRPASIPAGGAAATPS